MNYSNQEKGEEHIWSNSYTDVEKLASILIGRPYGGRNGTDQKTVTDTDIRNETIKENSLILLGNLEKIYIVFQNPSDN